MEIGQYVRILIESLEKKRRILQALREENKKQEEAIKENSDMEEFDRIVTYKGKLIQEMQILDGGFENVYNRIREELVSEKASYKEEIETMQSLIAEIMELSVGLQVAEQRNKQLVEGYFSYAKGKIKQAKRSVRVASEYYKSMSRANYADSALLDKKK